jgi:hypothetical protein
VLDGDLKKGEASFSKIIADQGNKAREIIKTEKSRPQVSEAFPGN